MKKPIIKTIDLTHTYPAGVTALKGVNTEIYEKDIVSIVGQNGSGKTTLVKHFNGLLKPTSGQVLIDGIDTKEEAITKLSSMVGYVFQNPNHQIFSTTVREELEVALVNFKVPEHERKKALERVIELMGLENELEKHPLTLDYTTKKIVTIASMLVYNPRVLVLDEPTGGLDEAGRRLLTKIIELLHGEGQTVIIISHDMDYVAENSERVIVMANGQIIKDDRPERVFLDAAVLEEAMIEPPQITQLDLYLSNDGSDAALSVSDFVGKYQ